MNIIGRARAGNICANFPNARILVVGDLMLDHWVWGEVSRISPEAPVPVVDVEHYSYTPGGAANVVANLKTLGATVDLAGVVGADDAGRRLRTMLRRQGVGTAGIVVQENYPTSLKSRIIANHQQVVRADLEVRTAAKPETWKQILAWIKEHLNEYSAVVLSDYNKGLLWGNHVAELIAVINNSVPVIAGPKPENIERFKGVKVITLNASESRTATGHNPDTPNGLKMAGEALLKMLTPAEVVITRGSVGMSLFQPNHPMVSVPALASQVFDVSGAGDTVLSVVALCKAVGVDTSEAIALASHAAAVVVRKVGTATVSSEELLASLDQDKPDYDLPSSKVLSRVDASQRIARLRDSENGCKVVFTNGCFDILHVGHLRTLMAAKHEGDVLVVGLNSDSSVKALKGEKRPINNQSERAELLAGFECVDMVVIFDEQTPLKLIEELRPDVHVKGGEYQEEDLPEAALVKSFGGKIVLAKMIPGRSTSEIVRKADL